MSNASPLRSQLINMDGQSVNWGSHSKHAGDEVRDLDEEDKRVLKFVVESINEENRFHFIREEAQPAQQAENVK